MPIVDIPASGGGWFKPTEEMKSYVAFLIETLDFEKDRPGTFGPKDSALVNLVAFDTLEGLEAGTPVVDVEGMRIEYGVLANQLASLVKKGHTIQRLISTPSKKPGQKPYWSWTPVTGSTRGKVVEFLEAREAALEAELASAPSFD